MGRRGEIRRDGRGYWEVGKGWEDRGRRGMNIGKRRKKRKSIV